MIGHCASVLQAPFLPPLHYYPTDHRTRFPFISNETHSLLSTGLSRSDPNMALSLSYVLNDVRSVEGKTLNAVLFGKLLEGAWGPRTGSWIVAFVMGSDNEVIYTWPGPHIQHFSAP